MKNWKVTSTSSTFKYDGVEYVVDARSPLCTTILRKTLEQLTIAMTIHKKIEVIRFDLKSSNFKHDNAEISLFRKRLVQWIERTYQTHSVGFLWARECETSKKQHYHLAIWIDGNKIRRSDKLKLIIQDMWISADPSNHAIWNCEKPYLVNSDEVFREVVFRLSYLAKYRGKGYRPDQSNDYSTSRLKIK